jgi:hypothetical protein
MKQNSDFSPTKGGLYLNFKTCLTAKTPAL